MEVKARAPGKIILAGEHAVVHGSTAVAASIDIYTHVSLRLSSNPGKGLINFTMYLFNMFVDFSVCALCNFKESSLSELGLIWVCLKL